MAENPSSFENTRDWQSAALEALGDARFMKMSGINVGAKEKERLRKYLEGRNEGGALQRDKEELLERLAATYERRRRHRRLAIGGGVSAAVAVVLGALGVKELCDEDFLDVKLVRTNLEGENDQEYQQMGRRVFEEIWKPLKDRSGDAVITREWFVKDVFPRLAAHPDFLEMTRKQPLGSVRNSTIHNIDSLGEILNPYFIDIGNEERYVFTTERLGELILLLNIPSPPKKIVLKIGDPLNIRHEYWLIHRQRAEQEKIAEALPGTNVALHYGNSNTVPFENFLRALREQHGRVERGNGYDLPPSPQENERMKVTLIHEGVHLFSSAAFGWVSSNAKTSWRTRIFSAQGRTVTIARDAHLLEVDEALAMSLATAGGTVEEGAMLEATSRYLTADDSPQQFTLYRELFWGFSQLLGYRASPQPPESDRQMFWEFATLYRTAGADGIRKINTHIAHAIWDTIPKDTQPLVIPDLVEKK